MDLPKEGTGTVSLNKMATNAVVMEPRTANNVQTAPVASPAPAPVSKPTAPNFASIQSAGAFTLPNLGSVPDLGIPVAEVANGNQIGGSGYNLKLWGGILVGSIVLLLGVFFYLANSTSLFKGSVGEIEEIVTPPATNFDQSTNSSSSSTPVASVPATDSTNSSSNSPLLENPILDDSNLTVPSSTTDNENDDREEIDLTPNSESIIDTGATEPDLTSDPEFGTNNILPSADDLISSLNTPKPTVDQNLLNLINNPTPTGVTTVEFQPTPATPANTLPAAPQATNSANGIRGSLASNTNAAVLNSANVQGDTGPAMLFYLAAPLAVVLRRFKKA